MSTVSSERSCLYVQYTYYYVVRYSALVGRSYSVRQSRESVSHVKHAPYWDI